MGSIIYLQASGIEHSSTMDIRADELVNEDSGTTEPRELEDKKVGFQTTISAAVWVRGSPSCDGPRAVKA
jgi:hypothetical protein